MVVHAPAERILQTAGLGAHAAVAAALADQGRHVALARVAEAQGPVHKDLRLDGGVLSDIADLVKAQLPCQHRAGQTQLRRGLHARQIMDRHLGAGVQGDVRQVLADGGDETEILDDDAVGPAFGGEAGTVQSGLDLAVVDQGVERDVNLAAADAAVTDGALELLVGEVLRAAAGIEIAHTHIYGVRAVLHRGDDGLGRSGGREQFCHICVFAPLVMINGCLEILQAALIGKSQSASFRTQAKESFRPRDGRGKNPSLSRYLCA